MEFLQTILTGVAGLGVGYALTKVVRIGKHTGERNHRDD